MAEAALDFLGHRRRGDVVDEDPDPRRQRAVALLEPADRVAAPHQAALLGDLELGVGADIELVGAPREFGLQRGLAGQAQGLALLAFRRFVDGEPEAVEPADEMALDADLAVVVHFGHKPFLLLQPAHQHAGAPVDKSLRQALVQRLRQPVLDLAGGLPPGLRIVEPAAPVGHIGPGPDEGQPFRQRVDVAVDPVDPPDLPGDPVRRYYASIG